MPGDEKGCKITDLNRCTYTCTCVPCTHNCSQKQFIHYRPLASLEKTRPVPPLPAQASSSSLPAAFSATLHKAGPLEVQTLITELEYFSKLQGMAPGDKRKEEESAEAAGEAGRALPGAAEAGRAWSLGRGRPQASGRTPHSHAAGQAPPAGGAELRRASEPPSWPCPRGIREGREELGFPF